MNISVVIPAWNAERYIARAIRSVLAQTRPAGEIIVIDDGSTDGTADGVRPFGKAVRLIQQPNDGVSIARNTGVAAATGDWIAFLDADDEWLPDKLEKQSQFFQEHLNLKWAFSNFCRDSDISGQGILPPCTSDAFNDYLDAYCGGFYAWTGTVIIHRTVFEAVGNFEPGMKRAQDNDLWFRIAYQFPQVGYLAQPLAVYHTDIPGSSTKINDQVDFMIAFIERHQDLSRRENRSEAFTPCIQQMLYVWIRKLIVQHRTADARLLLKRYNPYLSSRFRREMQIRLYLPGLGNCLADAVDRLKKRQRREWSL